MKVQNEIDIYEVDGQETRIPVPKLVVNSHWNRDSLVVLESGDMKISVSAAQLRAAIANATNTSRHQ